MRTFHPCALATCMVAALALTAPLAAQVNRDSARAARPAGDSVTVTPSVQYGAGSFGRWVLGDHYRDLWATPLRVPILNLYEFAGGLTVERRGGGSQTRSLRFIGKDGREYVFRSVDKDPGQSLPPELRNSYAEALLRDVTSATHPAGAAVVARLLDGLGVLHATPRMFVMPNDTALGPFRETFAGLLGWVELRPTQESEGTAGFEGASKIISTEKLLERMDAHGAEQPDARAYLAARMIDMFVGDWDRNPGQWRWARLDSAGPRARAGWQPIPRDRDWAMAKLDGVALKLARALTKYPKFVSFERNYPDLVWLNFNGRLLDRRLLSSLGRPVWDSVSAALRDRLTDALFDEALRALPPEMHSADGELRAKLIARRDGLQEMLGRFYLILSNEADVHSSDDAELVDIVRVDDRFTDITIRQRTGTRSTPSTPTFQRRFDRAETREVRLYIHGGDDRVIVHGAGSSAIGVRVVSGGGKKEFVDSTNSGQAAVAWYDTSATSTLASVRGGSIDRRPHVEPPVPPAPGWMDPPRDWGSRWMASPSFGFSSDLGLYIAGGPFYQRDAFRFDPYKFQMRLRVGYATGARGFRVEYTGDFRQQSSRVHTSVLARASQVEVVRYFGTGNETPAPVTDPLYYKVGQQLLQLEAAMHFPLGPDLSVGIGPVVRHANTTLALDRLIGVQQPYGVLPYSDAGLKVQFIMDRRDEPLNARSGVFFVSNMAAYTPLASGQNAYESVRSLASAYISAPGYLEPTLAVRVGGDKIWGAYPYFDGAYVGGNTTVRGWREQRFAGSSSVFANVEARVFLTKFFFLLPGQLGAFGLFDTGRVFNAGESSNAWHTGVGGGLWIAPLSRSKTFSMAAAHGPEGMQFYVRTGMLY